MTKKIAARTWPASGHYFRTRGYTEYILEVINRLQAEILSEYEYSKLLKYYLMQNVL